MKTIFQKTILGILLFLSFYSCQNDEVLEVDNKMYYLSKIRSNGKLSQEYIYDQNKLVQRFNQYDTLGQISGYRLYKYDEAKKLVNALYYNSSAFSGMNTFTYDNKMRLTEAKYYYSSDTTSNRYSATKYVYNKVGLCDTIKQYDSSMNLRYSIAYLYTGSNRTKAVYLTKDSIYFSLEYEYDNKPSFQKNVSSNPMLFSENNMTKMSSTDIISKGGKVNEANGTIVSNKVYIPGLTTGYTTFTFYFYSYNLEYNSFGYPSRVTSTNLMNPSIIIVNEYEYIEVMK